MSDVRNYLLTVDKDKQQAFEIAQSTASKLMSKELTLIDIVQSLGDYINEEDATTRSKAIDFLSHIIGALQPTSLSRQQIQVLCRFLCNRITDGGAVMGLIKLQQLRRFNTEMATMTFRAMLENFQDLQARPQSQRVQILELLNSLMSNHRAAIKSLADESLVGIVDLVNGEKDPRNLMMIFSVLKVIMVEWDVVAHAEMLFDSVFCYFPITFRPPPDDPYGISAQDLKARLRECIASSQLFAPYAFPQLIDKLDSTSPTVKKDVLQTISACASSYDIMAMSNYSVTIWDSLKYEILNGQEEDLVEEALAALSAIAVKLSHGLNSADPTTALATYLKPITKECNEQLQSPQHKQAKPVGQILRSLGATSCFALFLIVRAVLPPLLNVYEDADSISKQRALLEVLLQLLDAALQMYSTMATAAKSEIGHPLEPFKDRLFELFGQALMGTPKEEVSFRIVSLKCLSRLSLLPSFLQDNEIGLAVQYFDEVVLLDSKLDRDDLKDAAIEAIVELSKLKPALILDITFPAFMARLPDVSPEDDSGYILTLESLAQVSTEKTTSDTLARRLFSRLDIVLQGQGTPLYPRAILSTLFYVLGRRDLASDTNLGTYYEKVVRLVRRATIACTDLALQTALNDPATMTCLGRLLCLVIHGLDIQKQALVCQQAYTLFCEEETFAPVPHRQQVPEMQRCTMTLSTYILAGVGRGAWQIPLPYGQDDILVLFDDLVRMALVEMAETIRISLLQQIALLVNKFMSVDKLSHATEALWSTFSGLFESSQLTNGSIRVGFWIAKGLILRMANTDDVLSHLLGLLEHTRHGATAARGFALILAHDEIVSKYNGANIRLLAKQKVFNFCIPVISKAARTSHSTSKINYLVALSGILRHMTTAVLLPEIETLLPLLIQSLDFEDQDVKTASIETLTIICKQSPRTIEEHISSLVSRLLKLAADPKRNSSRVRHNALICLGGFPGRLKESILLPHRKAVTRGMMIVLDDPRRNVRKEAVSCMTAWLNVDEPEDP